MTHIWSKSGILIWWRRLVTLKEWSNPIFFGNTTFYIMLAQHNLTLMFNLLSVLSLGRAHGFLIGAKWRGWETNPRFWHIGYVRRFIHYLKSVMRLRKRMFHVQMQYRFAVNLDTLTKEFLPGGRLLEGALYLWLVIQPHLREWKVGVMHHNE